MKTINLKDYYNYYTHDMFIEIPDELAKVFENFDKGEAAYERKKYRYKPARQGGFRLIILGHE